MNQQKTVANTESQGEEDANMVTVVDESRLHDATMVRDSDTTRLTSAPMGIARPTVRDSPSLTENQETMQHRQQLQYSSQGSNSDRESADEGLQTEVRLRQAMERHGRVVHLTERMTFERNKAMLNPTHWNRSVLDAFVLDNTNALR